MDVYEYFKNILDEKELKEDNLIENEGEYCKIVEEITKGSLMQKISENKKYTSTYNSLVDLYNHYRKRKELHNVLKTIKDQG